MFTIPLSETTLDEEEVEAATRVLRSRWLTMGEEVLAFEAEFAAMLGSRHAVAVSNGTSALEIAYRAAGLGSGDEVIIPGITFIACYNAARLCGARPVLADIQSEDDWTISVESVERCISPRTKLVVPMAHGGYPPDMTGLSVLLKAGGIAMIEDACHGPLAQVDGRPIGSFGLAGTWSFFGNKNMTTGEGGMITTDDDDFAAQCRLLRSHGITRPTWDRARGHAFGYDVAAVGMNARMDEIRAAIGRVQLRKLPEATRQRACAAGLLRKAVEARRIPGVRVPFSTPRGTSAHHLFCVLLPDAVQRDQVMEHMKAAGIQCSVHYPPVHGFSATQQWFATEGGAVNLPMTDRVAPRILTLPLFPALTVDQAEQIAEALALACSV